MLIKESKLRKIIRQELKSILAEQVESPPQINLDWIPPGRRQVRNTLAQVEYIHTILTRILAVTQAAKKSEALRNILRRDPRIGDKVEKALKSLKGLQYDDPDPRASARASAQEYKSSR